jgi:hypothetical protein
MSDEILTGLREIDHANATPLHDALDRLGQHGDGLEIGGARTKDGDISAEAGVTKTIGKGWSVAGGAQYVSDTWTALGKLMWRPKS